MNVVDGVKRRLHRDLVADPVLHGLVLNLYLNGERYPHRVDDYFPISHVTDSGLAAAMRQHIEEEDKHALLYEKAIRTLGQPIVELPSGDIFNEVIRSHTPASFKIRGEDDADSRTLKIAHFLAHLHYLEKRVARSLEYHVEGCAQSSVSYPFKAVGAVLRDEGGHVQYTRAAVRSLLPRSAAAAVLAQHAGAERRANLDFSSRQLKRLTREQRARFPAHRAAAYGACATLLRGVLFCV